MADDTLTHPKYLLMEPADMSLGWRLVQPAVIRLYALWRLMVDLFSALTYMHAIHAVHGDIKPENILLFNDGQGGYIAKLGDVGEANRAGASALGRTPFYSAPELLGVIDAKLEPACDVYASGVVIAEVALQLLVSGPKCYLRDGIRKCYPMSDFVGMIDSAIDVVYQSSWEMGHLLRLCCSREQSHRLPARDVLTQLKSLKIEKYPQPPLWQLKAEEDCIRNKDGSVALCRVETCGNQLRGSLVPTNFKKYKGYCKPCGDAMESARSARTATAHESIASQADRPHREGVIDPVVPPAVPDTTEDVSMSGAASQARQPPDSEENRCTTSSMDD
jgi:serine/threonine protein kinase